MEGMSFFSRQYVPPVENDRRLRELERYVSRQNAELTVLLNRMERRIEALEKRLSDMSQETAV